MGILTTIEPPDLDALWTAWGPSLREHCRAPERHDALLRTYLEAGYARFDGEAGTLGRALLTQKLRLSLSRFPSEIWLPLPPLKSVDEIAYTDPGGTTQVMALADWTVTLSEPGSLRLKRDRSFPLITVGFDAIRITFTAGYGAPADIPAPIRAAIFQHVAGLYENREVAAFGTGSFQAAPETGSDLVSSYKMRVF